MDSKAAAFIPLFPRKKIAIVLSSFLQAGKDLRKESDNERENQLSRRLHWRLIRIAPFRNGPLNISLQSEIVFTEAEAKTPSGQIDFLISCGLGAEVYLAVEAKRLRVRSASGKMAAGNDAYVNDGMMRFVTCQYAPFMEAGAMLGYVYDGEIDKARSGIEQYMIRKALNLKLLPPEHFLKSKILPNRSIDETRHNLERKSFTIYHIFIAV